MTGPSSASFGAPWWVVAASPVLLYGGVELALPLALRWSTLDLVAANIVCTAMAFVVVVAWFVVQADAPDRRHLVEWTTELRNLDSTAFEWLAGELFRREICKVKRTGRPDAPAGTCPELYYSLGPSFFRSSLEMAPSLTPD